VILNLWKRFLGTDEAGRSKMFEHEGIKGCVSLIYTDILQTPGAFMRSIESAEEDGEGMALKI